MNVQADEKVKYVCGKRCMATTLIMYELNGDHNFVNARSLYSSKMNSFNERLGVEIKRLKIQHNIIFRSSFWSRGEDPLPNFKSMPSAIKVYVNMTHEKLNYSQINFEVIFLSESGIIIQKLTCEKGEDSCIDDRLSQIFDSHILGYLRELP